MVKNTGIKRISHAKSIEDGTIVFDNLTLHPIIYYDNPGPSRVMYGEKKLIDLLLNQQEKLELLRRVLNSK